MSHAALAIERTRKSAVTSRRGGRVTLAALLWLVLLGNAAAMVWLWWHGGNVTRVHGAGEWLTSVARITGLLGSYSALLQVVLLSRLPFLERLAGFDRLTVWHRWNGHACLELVLAHVVFSVWGYALMDKIPIGKEVTTMLGGGVYPGMITATVGTGLLIAVVVSSIVVVRRRLPYEWWYALHLAAYASIALAWFHQIPTGNELVLDRVAADYWRAIYLVTLGLVVAFRVVLPLVNGWRYGLRVSEVVTEAPGVISLRMTGRGVRHLNARAGQFFLWRFLTKRHWAKAHPFSLSESPDGRSLRITVKALGDFTSRIGEIPPGTRVLVEGPFGTFTTDRQRREGIVLIGGGIGITPIRALMEDAPPGSVVIYRVLHDDDVIFRRELEQLAGERELNLHIVAGDHATDEGRRLLSPDHLRELVSDLERRDVFVCGPTAMTDALERNVRAAGVPRRFIHAERFAFST